jgi:hypothetical protein
VHPYFGEGLQHRVLIVVAECNIRAAGTMVLPLLMDGRIVRFPPSSLRVRAHPTTLSTFVPNIAGKPRLFSEIIGTSLGEYTANMKEYRRWILRGSNGQTCIEHRRRKAISLSIPV